LSYVKLKHYLLKIKHHHIVFNHSFPWL